METTYLLPNRYKRIGWLFLIPAILIGIPTVIYSQEPELFNISVVGIFNSGIGETSEIIGIQENNFFNELVGIVLIISGLMVAFSKEKDEDEFISSIRLSSLVWATYWNYAILLVALILVYDLTFYWVMLFNMFTILVLFIVKFNWSIWRSRKLIGYEEQHKGRESQKKYYPSTIGGNGTGKQADNKYNGIGEVCSLNYPCFAVIKDF